ncbi:hypothetical protein PVAND_013055 [Polypedilum vanderplanki]|uniref:Uncharacterized protein n=1 Tax=Polypedilum vanderplanki TaxID=319348 RepID=A0A9J6CPJ4_POLVA|nr:hypothetical protein PVAND_013055 [Polypedilum vanderplanki]
MKFITIFTVLFFITLVSSIKSPTLLEKKAKLIKALESDVGFYSDSYSSERRRRWRNGYLYPYRYGGYYYYPRNSPYYYYPYIPTTPAPFPFNLFGKKK